MIIVFFLRGKGDYYRLGHATDTHVRRPQMVEALKNKKVVDVAVGALHCLAVTDDGMVRLFMSCSRFGISKYHRQICQKLVQI